MVTSSERFVRLVQHNQEQPCQSTLNHLMALQAGQTTPLSCCNGTGRIPRPAAVELWQNLTRPCGHIPTVTTSYAIAIDWPCNVQGCPGRLPRSYAEAHLALEEWLQANDFDFGCDAGAMAPWWVKSSGYVRYHKVTLEQAAEAALVATEGWALLPEGQPVKLVKP